MLKEMVHYREGLPINCSVVNIEDYPIHFHDDMEVAFVLSGSVVLKNGYYTFVMEEGDIFILNDREIHSFYSMGKQNAVMLLQLDLNYFKKYYEILDNSFFVTDMEDREDSSLEVLRGILSRIMLETLEAEPGYERRAVEYTHDLIDCLCADFQYFALEDGKFVNEVKNRENKILAGRMRRITKYLYENYNRRLTLSEIADREHLSVFYLSHVIKEASGLSFQELLNFIRVEESEKLLLGTSKKIGTVSFESGFSAVRYYIKYFTKWFGMHPHEYREKYYGMVRNRENSSKLSPVQSEKAKKLIRIHAKDAYEDKDRKRIFFVFIDLDSIVKGEAATLAGKDIVDCITRLCEKHDADSVGAMLREFLNLEGEIIHFDNHCIVKTEDPADPCDRISILFYNYDEALSYENYLKCAPLEMGEIIARFDGKSEVLLKFGGLKGEYCEARQHINKDAVLAGLLGSYGQKGREELLMRWKGRPNVSFVHRNAIDALNVQSFMSGFSGELVLLDRITEQQSNT